MIYFLFFIFICCCCCGGGGGGGGGGREYFRVRNDYFCPQNISLLLDNTWPQLTPCFLDLVVTCAPCVIFWLAVPCHVYLTETNCVTQHYSFPMSRLVVAKLVCFVSCLCLHHVCVLYRGLVLYHAWDLYHACVTFVSCPRFVSCLCSVSCLCF